MKRVTGIGGIFFSAKDPVGLRAWYKTHPGIDVEEWGGTAFRRANRRWNRATAGHLRPLPIFRNSRIIGNEVGVRVVERNASVNTSCPIIGGCYVNSHRIPS